MRDDRGSLFSDVRRVTMEDRVKAVGIADNLIGLGYKKAAFALIDIVRCCGEFPECTHVLAYTEGERDG